MSVKQAFIIIGAALIFTILAMGVIVYIKSQPTTTTESTIGVRPTDNYEFKQIVVTGLPVFSQSPEEKDGWKLEETIEEATFSNIEMTNANSCTISMQSQETPYVNTTMADFALSKAYAESVARSQQGTLDDIYIITVPTSDGEGEFYAGNYHPEILLTSPGGTTPTQTGGSMTLDDSYTVFIAVRSIASPVNTVGTSTDTQDDVVPLVDSIPTIIIRYECLSDDFNIDDGIKLIKQMKLNVSPDIKEPTTTPSSGK